MGLGKIFINSITREVGRNVGKGISNDLFGDWHATPVRIAGRNAKKAGWDINFVKKEEYDVSVQPEYEYKSLVSCFLVNGVLGTILFFLIPLVWGNIIWLLVKKQTNLYARIPMRKADGRTKIGYRELGDTYVKLESKRLLNDDEKKRMKICALLVLLGHLAVIGLAFAVTSEVDKPKKQQMENVNSADDIKREDTNTDLKTINSAEQNVVEKEPIKYNSIIIGSFGTESNAENLKKSLLNEGFENIDISKVGNVNRVSILISGSKEDAQEVLKKVKVNHKSAWISYN